MSPQFCRVTLAVNDLASQFNARRMNCYGPLFSFDPRADCISYAPVFHMGEFGLKSKVKQCPSPEGEKAPRRTNDLSFERCGHEQSCG